jgi:hypothetical protein
MMNSTRHGRSGKRIGIITPPTGTGSFNDLRVDRVGGRPWWMHRRRARDTGTKSGRYPEWAPGWFQIAVLRWGSDTDSGKPAMPWLRQPNPCWSPDWLSFLGWCPVPRRPVPRSGIFRHCRDLRDEPGHHRLHARGVGCVRRRWLLRPGGC